MPRTAATASCKTTSPFINPTQLISLLDTLSAALKPNVCHINGKQAAANLVVCQQRRLHERQACLQHLQLHPFIPQLLHLQ